MKTYVSKIQELEGEVLRLKNSTNNTKRSDLVGCLELNDNAFTEFDAKIADVNGKLLHDTNCLESGRVAAFP